MVVDRVFADCLPRLPCGERQFVGALVVDHYVGGHLWFASLGFLVTKEVGHDWLDGVLHLGYSCFLFLPSAILLLENGLTSLGAPLVWSWARKGKKKIVHVRTF